LREKYQQEKGLSGFLAIQQDSSTQAKQRGLALAKMVGMIQAGIFQTSFEHEVLGDLFGEQALLCGGLVELIQMSFNTLIEKGIPLENAYLETVHQIDLLANLIRNFGVHGMTERISQTAQFGMMKFSDSLSKSKLQKQFEKLYSDIYSGKFSKDWQEEYKNKLVNLKAYKKTLRKSLLEQTSKKMRKKIG